MLSAREEIGARTSAKATCAEGDTACSCRSSSRSTLLDSSFGSWRKRDAKGTKNWARVVGSIMSIRYTVKQRLEVVALRLRMRKKRGVYVRAPEEPPDGDFFNALVENEARGRLADARARRDCFGKLVGLERPGSYV